MTRIKNYKMVQKQNIDIPLFSENQAWQSYIASFLMTLEEQPCLSGSKYWWVIDPFPPELTGTLAGHRATLWTKGSPFSLFLCLCGKGLWLKTPERISESRKPIAYFLWQRPQSQKTHDWRVGISGHLCTVILHSHWSICWYNWRKGTLHLRHCSLLCSRVLYQEGSPQPCSLTVTLSSELWGSGMWFFHRLTAKHYVIVTLNNNSCSQKY